MHNAEKPTASRIQTQCWGSGGDLRVVDFSMHKHIGYTRVMPMYARSEFMGSATFQRAGAGSRKVRALRPTVKSGRMHFLDRRNMLSFLSLSDDEPDAVLGRDLLRELSLNSANSAALKR
jgi:hypothetical protein